MFVTYLIARSINRWADRVANFDAGTPKRRRRAVVPAGPAYQSPRVVAAHNAASEALRAARVTVERSRT